MSALKKIFDLLLLVMMFALVSDAPIWAAAQAPISNARVFAYAEANYPGVFSGTPTVGQYRQYDYRYYPGSENYLGIDNTGGIYIYGPFTANMLTYILPVESLRSVITAWEANPIVLDACIAAPSKWALWAGGVCLRGANIWQGINIPSYGGAIGANPLGPPYTQADFNALAAMGANVVNISHPGLFSETAPYALNTDAQANLDNLLTMIKNANMFAVITFRTGPGRNEEDIVPQTGLTALYSVWTSQAQQDAWVAMWKYTAARYTNNLIVVGYDLMCEPHPNLQSPTPTSTPSEFYPAYANTLYDWNPLAQRISAAIRQVDSATPILIGGMDWSGARWLGSLTSNGDNKTVYMVHQYEPQEGYTHQPAPYTNTYGTLTGAFTRADLLTQFAYIFSFKSSRSVPVAVNEFGVMRFQPNAVQYLSDEMDIMESNGLNYSIWLWESSYPGIDYGQFNFRRGTDPANSVDVVPNALTTTIQRYFQKNTIRPSNRSW